MAQGAVILRPARAADAPAMSRLSREHIEAGLDWKYSPARIAALIDDADTMVLAACDAAGLRGFAVMQFGDERAHLVLMCTAPGSRRQGVGRRLLEWLFASARVAGIASVHLELRIDNDAAHAFYRALGFADTLVVPGYYQGRVAARRMLRLLGAPPAAA